MLETYLVGIKGGCGGAVAGTRPGDSLRRLLADDGYPSHRRPAPCGSSTTR
jgi:hypothetical protein